MSKKNYSRTITIFGATGFLGQAIVQKLAKNNHKIKVATRNPYLAQNLKVLGDMGQIEIHQVDIFSEQSINLFLKESDVCINLIGILYEKKSQKFFDLHSEFPNKLTRIFSKISTSKLFIHFSALGVNNISESKYISSKFQGEQKVKKNFSNYIILRPSIVVGPKDNFFNMFAKLANLLPFIPLVGASTKFQPVYVVDVAEAVSIIIEKNISKKIFELGGPQIYSFLELINFLLNEIKKKRLVIPIPSSIGKIQAFFLQLMPNPLLTLDQIKILESGDNIVSNDNKKFEDLGIKPKSIETIVPHYLKIYRSGGQFSD